MRLVDDTIGSSLICAADPGNRKFCLREQKKALSLKKVSLQESFINPGVIEMPSL
jgi:hypothetical protein